jgi:hypothetical protein
MEKSRWLEFISSRLKSQISLENAEKAQTWGFLFLGLASLAFALQAVASGGGSLFLYATKILFLMIFQLVILLGVYLPAILQKERQSLPRLLGIRDFTSLMLASLLLTFYSAVVSLLSFQTAAQAGEMELSNFFAFVAWIQFFVSLAYFGGCLFFLAALLLFPQALTKIAERGSKAFWALLGLHAGLFFFLSFGYSEITPIGSVSFFEQFRVAGLFWIFIVTSLFFLGKMLRGSSVSALSALELEIASGRLERQEDILARLKDAFILERLAFWVNRLSHDLATKAHQIAQWAHEGITLVQREKPTELDLRLVEDRYRRADALYKKIEKENQRFLLSVSFFVLSQSEQEKIEFLRDQFSRELRNAKLELASIRKKIDERLTALKTSQEPLRETPVSEVPLTK